MHKVPNNKITIFKGTKDLNREKFYEIETGWDLKSLAAVRAPDKCLLNQQNTKKLPWTARRSNQSILKEINPEYSLEGLMLKLQFFGPLIWWSPDSWEKALMLGKIEGRRRRGGQRMRWLDGITDLMDMSEWVSESRLVMCDSLRTHGL